MSEIIERAEREMREEGGAWRRIMQRIEPHIQAFIDRIETD